MLHGQLAVTNWSYDANFHTILKSRIALSGALERLSSVYHDRKSASPLIMSRFGSSRSKKYERSILISLLRRVAARTPVRGSEHDSKSANSLSAVVGRASFTRERFSSAHNRQARSKVVPRTTFVPSLCTR